MKVKIQNHDDGLTVTPVKKHGRARYVGTAIISNVKIEGDISTGDLVGEYLETHSLAEADIPKSVKDKMKPLTTGVVSAKVVYATHKEILYLSNT